MLLERKEKVKARLIEMLSSSVLPKLTAKIETYPSSYVIPFIISPTISS